MAMIILFLFILGKILRFYIKLYVLPTNDLAPSESAMAFGGVITAQGPRDGALIQLAYISKYNINQLGV